MVKRKLQQFEEFKQFNNTFDFDRSICGKWNTIVFQNKNPIILELGCGKGEYTVNLAQAFPENNYIGIDIKSNRMWRGAKTANDLNLTNVAFMRASISLINEFFLANEVDEIWITFPDPFPKDRHEKHRLTFEAYLRKYAQLLKPNAFIQLKTDDPDLFQYTLDTINRLQLPILSCFKDVHEDDTAPEYLKNIQTYYETKFREKGRKIQYVKFNLDKLK